MQMLLGFSRHKPSSQRAFWMPIFKAINAFCNLITIYSTPTLEGLNVCSPGLKTPGVRQLRVFLLRVLPLIEILGPARRLCLSFPKMRGTRGEGCLVFQTNAERAAKNRVTVSFPGLKTPGYKHATLPGLCLKDIFGEPQKSIRVHCTHYACER